ncbi:MAG TPA: hypothetical protein VM075_11495 [Anaerolineae bacterium]|nr:hypothetical protein [Anaerolineae bacterium]
MSRLSAGFPRKRAIYADATLLPVAPEPFLSTEFQLRGLDREQGVSVSVSDHLGVPVEWVSPNEARLSVVAPQKALIKVSSGQEVITFTTHELILYGAKERPTSGGAVEVEILSGKVLDWDPTAGLSLTPCPARVRAGATS